MSDPNSPYDPPKANVVTTTASGVPREALNPWFSMWFAPRATIQQIVNTDPKAMVLLLASVSGFNQALSRASMRSLGDEMAWPNLLLFSAVAGPIGGIFTLYLGAALLHWTGKWIGGAAPVENIRAAIAWVTIPVIWTMVLWVPELALFGQEMFTSETPRIDADPGLAMAIVAFGIVELIAGIWIVVILFKCLGQVQGFSAWKALGNFALAVSALILPIFALAVLVSVFR